jgi:molybdenum cofactor cytidylyltransferase
MLARLRFLQLKWGTSLMGNGSDMQVVGVLLAAGSGRRFAASGGGNKLLATVPGAEQVAVAVASARAMLAALPRVVAVVPDDDGQLGQALQRAGCDVTVCANAALGMGASLVHALTYALGQTGQAGRMPIPQGWVIALADMPYVHHATIASLRAAIVAGAGIAVPVYQGRRGNPVGFGSEHLDQLLALNGDQGARAIVKAHPVTEVEVDDPGIFRDIDTVEDLARD